MNTDSAAVAVTLEVDASRPMPHATLPKTGADLDLLVLLGTTLLLVGAVVLLLVRTRLETTDA